MPVEDPGILTGLVPADFPSEWLFFFACLDLEQKGSLLDGH